jgi:hypothetical protein
MRILALTLAVALGALTACGGASSHPEARSVPSVVVRSCSMVGFGGLRPGWRRRALIFGPLAFGDLREYTAGQPLPGRIGRRYGAYEITAIVQAGAQPVLSLPNSEWSSVGLLYDPSKFRDDGAYRLRDLDQVIRFRACRSRTFNHGVSQFDGGFVVTRRQCVHFEVQDSSGHTYTGEFPVAAPCPRP